MYTIFSISFINYSYGIIPFFENSQYPPGIGLKKIIHLLEILCYLADLHLLGVQQCIIF